MKIKASSINNLTDARYFAAWNVEWLGFSLQAGSSNYTRPQDVKEIKEWLVGPKIVGEFGIGQSAEEIKTSVELLNLDAVQLNMFTENEIAKNLEGLTVIKEWITEDLSYLETFAKQCKEMSSVVDYFYLNLEKSGISWKALRKDKSAYEQLKSLCQEYAIIISIVCPAENLKDFLDGIQPHGISLSGGEEEKVGLKTFDDLDDIYDALEAMNLLNQEI